ncbi:galactose oxidase [Pseudovirgaria hyperparasitica]|uniref:Galactose oxidase n=1 Tax=Pseudovirgaria hyperparasitica TaxID=470096 RepID=A0A6A6WFT2_9PEZI|nr:galactose oxidase [Pseudovirgaria hyperparasitica]KAF2760457.1 galactose oxidase [Pseudovirgaria hyperparasitica]
MLFQSHSLLLFSSLIPAAFPLGLQIGRDNWKIIADSQHAGNEAQKAIDGDRNTFWHSEYAPNAPLPHNVVVDMGEFHLVDGISILPRQDNFNNGNIGQHLVQLSGDGKTWGRPVALGQYRNDKGVKETSFVRKVARYVKITAVTEAQNAQNPWTSIAELNIHQVADPFINSQGFTFTADSEETARENGRASNLNDNLPYTIWHTNWSGNAPAHPHYLTINQNKRGLVGGIQYVPRQGIGAINQPENGRIGRYRIESSNDGQNWNTVKTGTWADDDTNKAAFWPAINVQYIRLVALSEAGNRGPWTSAGDVQLMFGSSLADHKAPSASLGVWSHTVDFPLVPAAAANLYDGAADEILVWSAFANDQFFQFNQGKTQVTIYNSTDSSMTPQEIANTQHDMFCPGLSMDSTGRFIVTGGNDAAKTSIYDPRTNQWQKGAEMNVPRGYQSSATLSNGNVFTLGGSWSGGHEVDKDGEVYNIKSNTWTKLPGARVAPTMTHDHGGRYRSDNHQWFFAWSNGNILHAGPSAAMNWIGTSGQGSINGAGNRAQDGDSMNGIAAMYDAPAGKILTAGGAANYQGDNAHARAHIITINGVGKNPSVQRIGDMKNARGFHTSVVLPDGTVIVLGGQTHVEPFTDTYAVTTPELFNPRDNSWTVLNSNAVPRTYHSTSLLLKDGSIFSAGGGLCGNCATNHFDGEVFLPPYLVNSDGTTKTRPVITSINGDSFAVGSQIQIKTDSAVTSIALMRLGSVTHTVNTDQRRIPFTVSGTSQTITIPNDPGVALPGYYYVFALNAAGVPSIARVVQITFTQQAAASSETLPTLQVLHTMPEPAPETSITDFLNVTMLTDLLPPLDDSLTHLTSIFKDVFDKREGQE